MVTITQLREIADHVRSLPNKNAKAAYLDTQPREILNFLAGNIRKDGIAKAIAGEIPKGLITESTMEDIVDTFKRASQHTGRLDKIGEMSWLRLLPVDKDFVMTALYGSLKLGITVPIPDPIFGDTFAPQLCGANIEFDPRKYLIERKYDGIRCLGMNIDGKIKLYTRNGKPITAEAIEVEMADAIPPGFVVDGELVAKSGDFQDLKRHSDDIEYRVFDMPFINGDSVTGLWLRGRRGILEETLHETDRISISPVLSLANMDDINKWIDREGAEGVVAKDPESFYTYSGRKDWIKVKPWIDVTCRVTGFTRGDGKRDRDDMIGAIEVVPAGSQVKTLVGTGFSDEDLIQMRQLLREQKSVTVDVKYQNLTNDGCLRFPVFLRIREVI